MGGIERDWVIGLEAEDSERLSALASNVGDQLLAVRGESRGNSRAL